MADKQVRTNQTLIQIPRDLTDEEALRRVLTAIIVRLDMLGYYEVEDLTFNTVNGIFRPRSIVATSRQTTKSILDEIDQRLTALESA